MTAHQYIESHLPQMRVIAKRVAFKFFMDADDLLQDGVVSVLHYQFRDPGMLGFLKLFNIICNHRAVDLSRKRTTCSIPELQIPIHPKYVHDDRRRLASIFWGIRRRLTPRHAASLYLQAQGYSVGEIAELYKLKVSQVNNLLEGCRLYLTPRKAVIPEFKFCPSCEKTLPSAKFYRFCRRRDGLTLRCRTCHKAHA